MRTLHAWKLSDKDGLVLKKIQVPPRMFTSVVTWSFATKNRTDQLNRGIEVQKDMDLSFLQVQVHV